MNISEEALLSGLKLGEETAFSKIYALHVRSIYAFVLKILKSPSISEDVVQEVFIKLWENAPKIDAGTSIKPYLFTIARNLHLTSSAMPAENSGSVMKLPHMHLILPKMDLPLPSTGKPANF